MQKLVMNRRSVLVTGAALLAAPAVLRAADADVVRFGVLYPNLTTVIHAIALKTGAYERNGIKIEETKFKSGQTVDGVEQLWRGELDFYMGGAPEIPRLNSRVVEAGGTPPLAVVSGANPGHTSLVLSNKLQPKSIDEILKQPLQIAVSSPSSVHLAFFRGYLTTEKKMDPNSIGWKFLSLEAGNMLAALTTNQIDGFLHSEPTTTLAIVKNVGHLFMSARRGDMGPNPPPATFMSSRRDYIKKNNAVAKRFMRAIFDANQAFEKAPKDEMVKIIAEWGGLEEDIVSAAYERMNPVTSLTEGQAMKWWNTIASTMVERGELTSKLDPMRDVFDLSLQPA